MNLDYDMIEMIENRLEPLFPKKYIYKFSPFDVDDLRDCLLMAIIKDAYYETSEKRSLRANRGNDLDDVRMRDSRNLAYAQHYRNLQYEHLKNDNDIIIEELRPDRVSSMEEKLEGHKLTEMQYYELNTIADHPLLKSIVSKRICDVKKISNETFIDYMNDYESLVEDLKSKLDGNDDDVIFSTIALFTLEWKYNVELFYACAERMEKYNVSEIPKNRLGLLCAELSYPLPYSNQIVHTESRFILHRMDLIESVFKENKYRWAGIKEKMWQYLCAEYFITTEILDKWSMGEFFQTHIPKSEWAKFFREHYDLRKIYVKKEWSNKRIRNVRNIYNTMIKTMPTPSKAI